MQESVCLNGCSGNGHCFSGTCSCFAEFDGQDCSTQVVRATESISSDRVLVVQHGETISADSPCHPGLEFAQVAGVRVNCNRSDIALFQQQGQGVTEEIEKNQFQAIVSKDSARAAPVTASWIPTLAAATTDSLQVASESISVADKQVVQSAARGRDVALLAAEEPSALAFASQTALAAWVTDGRVSLPDVRRPPNVARSAQPIGAESPEDGESLEDQRSLEVGLPAKVADAPQYLGQLQQQRRLLLSQRRDDELSVASHVPLTVAEAVPSPSRSEAAAILGLLASSGISASNSPQAETTQPMLPSPLMSIQHKAPAGASDEKRPFSAQGL